MDYELIRPFGPTIYCGKMSQELMTMLAKCVDNTRNSKINIGSALAGNIKNQFELVLAPKDQIKFIDLVSVHLRNYFKEEWERGQLHLIKKYNDDPNFKNMSFELTAPPWVNFQQANEFNPIHSHSGIASAVLYIDIPEEIAQEANGKLTTNMPCPGQIEFIYGSDVLGVSGTHKIIPKTGDILLFHAGLKHTVYPFSSKVERISMSFNVNISGYVN